MELREYQKDIAGRAVEKLRKYGCCYLSMECRTGKTITSLEVARRYGATSVLFVTKKKAIASVLSDYESLRNVTPLYRMDVVNYESLHKNDMSHDFVIVDEAHSLGAYPRPSKRAVTLKKICAGHRVLFLSGTPSPESYSQLFHQFWCCDFSPFKEYKNFYKWAKVYVDVIQRKVNGYLINDYSHANEQMITASTRHLFVSYTQKEAGFRSSVSERGVTVPMNLGTADLLRQLWRHKIVSISGETILGDTPAKLLGKMHQLSSGTVITESGKVIITDTSKAEYIRDHFSGRLAIFYVYTAEFDLLKSVFPCWTDVPEEFQSNPRTTFLCQIRKAREGVRLDAADHLVFYNLEYSFLSYEQGKNRVVSKERKADADVVFLLSDCGIDREILRVVRQKKDFTLHYYRTLVNG